MSKLSPQPFSAFLLPILVLPAVLCNVTPARADRFDLSVGSTAHWLRSSTVDALSGDDLHSALSLNAGMRVDRWRGSDFLVDVGFESGETAGSSFGQLRSELGQTTFTVGLRSRRQVTSRLDAFARAAVGLSRLSLTMSGNDSSSVSLSDSGTAGVFYLGAGLEFTALRLQRRRGGDRFALSLRAEAGLQAVGAVALHAIPDASGDASLVIPAQAASLGSLRTSSVSARFGVVVRF